MKILFFYQYFTTPEGSWSTRVYELTRRWVDQGVEVTVVTSPYEKSDIRASGFISKQKIDGINLIVIDLADSNRDSFFKRVLNAVTFSLVAVYYSLRLNYDIVVCSSGPITIGIPGLVAKWFRRKPFLMEIRDLWPAGAIEMGLLKSEVLKRIALKFESALYRNADFIVSASPGQRDFLIAKDDSLKSKTGVIPNASDNYLFSGDVELKKEERLKIEQKYLFTHIGSLGFIHYPHFLLDVASELLKTEEGSQIAIVFIGEGALRSELENRKEKEELSNVYFLGIKPKLDLPAWVQASISTLFTTLDNPVQDTCSPNKIFDSFAAGVPIIQTTRGWIKDLIDTNGCGINVEPGNAQEFAKKMIYLANQPVDREMISRNAFKVSQEYFDRDKLAVQYLGYLSNILGK
ncbi:glycosyltransferase family 4 protein [Algoriphagus hitonicola]|uniref:Glycosyltransferase involved in cell wall bisynthesis n=1 Tax=Algoriphagus hitonicola TaxID=435880 RepID=A0A1I2X604_9BACT|nr:glycosyltransferase family 4 protein [Algoriphagus hitonicola]SFH08116.1 Glycosyltransferase involved in cell wall bisynthesis [Algoriphagus hitonicola]